MIANQKNISAMGTKPLAGISVMLSASVPDEVGTALNAQDILSAIIIFTKKIISFGGDIVFGGHPTITPLISKSALSVSGERGVVHLYQLRRFQQHAPEDIWDKEVFRTVNWIGDEKEEAPIESELAEMRDAMCSISQAAIFIGGKTTGYHGSKPGIRDEYDRFLNQHPKGPVYLLGLMNGESAKIIADLEQKELREPNGLASHVLSLVHHENDIDLIAPIVVNDIAKFARP